MAALEYRTFRQKKHPSLHKNKSSRVFIYIATLVCSSRRNVPRVSAKQQRGLRGFPKRRKKIRSHSHLFVTADVVTEGGERYSLPPSLSQSKPVHPGISPRVYPQSNPFIQEYPPESIPVKPVHPGISHLPPPESIPVKPVHPGISQSNPFIQEYWRTCGQRLSVVV